VKEIRQLVEHGLQISKTLHQERIPVFVVPDDSVVAALVPLDVEEVALLILEGVVLINGAWQLVYGADLDRLVFLRGRAYRLALALAVPGEEIGHLQIEGLDDLLAPTTTVAVEQDLAIFILPDGQGVLGLTIVCWATGPKFVPAL